MELIYNLLRNPFANWWPVRSNTSGIIHLYADYKISVKEIRKQLNTILSNHPQWDGYTASIEVAESKKNHTSLRILSSSHSNNGGQDFQMEIREKIVDFINRRYPECLVKTRIEGMLVNN